MAPDFKEGQSNMYHITIRASTVENNNFLETEKTFTVTVTKTNTGGNPDDDGGFHITTANVSTKVNLLASRPRTISKSSLIEVTLGISLLTASVITTANVSTPEQINKVITLATNKGGARFTIVGNKGKFSLSGTALTFEGADFFCWF
jgi:hypothetical protein